MDYISVFSGIEAATVAWHDFGWNPVAFAEIEPFPSAVLQYHYPNVPNLGDVMKIEWEQYKGKADLIVGGSPCQSFSIGGKRLGMDDPRGNLALHYLRIVRAIQPKWFVFENVPGLLSSNGGNDFSTFLGEVAKCGYGFAYRVLDSQYFGVPQRRRRVFVVGCANRDWRSSAAILFDKESLCGNLASSKTEGKTSSLFSKKSVRRESRELGRRGIVHCSPVAPTMMASGPPYSRTGQTTEDEALVVQNPILPIHDKATRYKGGGKNRNNDGASNFLGVGMNEQSMYCLTTSEMHMIFNQVVRRITPLECERLQGFPDDYTKISWNNKETDECPNSLRYTALGNSMTVPVMRWIGERIKLLDSIDLSKRENPKTTKQMKLW